MTLTRIFIQRDGSMNLDGYSLYTLPECGEKGKFIKFSNITRLTQYKTSNSGGGSWMNKISDGSKILKFKEPKRRKGEPVYIKLAWK